MSKVVRSVKNVTKGYTHAQVKVRNATSNDPWGPVGSDMAEIAQMTYDTATFHEIMDILDKRLNDKGKNWRHVLKSLKVLDYCLHEGSEHVVTWSRKNIYIIKTLREFQHIDDDGRDVGQNIRVSAKELTSLILDEERLRAERQDRRSWKSRVTGLEDFAPPAQSSGDQVRRSRRERPTNDEDDLEYRLAIEASKNEAEEEAKRRARLSQAEGEDADLAKAIRLSKEEEELRRRELEEQNAQSLFDDTPTPTQPAASQPTGWNQGYQQQPTVDWFGNVIDPQQQQNTGFGLQGQPTGYQNGFGYPGYQQNQQTAFQNPLTTGFVQPQQTAFTSNNPYAQPSQSNGFGVFAQQQPLQQQQQQQQQQTLQQQDTLQPGSNNPWTSTQQDLLDMKPQPTGSNNPFATAFPRPASQPSFKQPTLNTLSEQKASSSFNPIANYQSSKPLQQQPQPHQAPSPFSPPSGQPPASNKPLDPHHARLNALLASGEGQDTFGNVGETRIPAQHTAPGIFVNSAGAGAAQRIGQTATGTANPFFNPSQFTGAPQTTGFGGGGGASQMNKLVMPAQTGPAGAFGAASSPFGFGGAGTQPHQQGSNNPFGAAPFGQQAQPQQQNANQGSLIDL